MTRDRITREQLERLARDRKSHTLGSAPAVMANGGRNERKGIDVIEPQWQEPTDDMPDGWYWCESLGPGSPPQYLSKYTATKYDWIGAPVIVFKGFHRKTGYGGMTLVMGRVAPCTGRPAAKGGE